MLKISGLISKGIPHDFVLLVRMWQKRKFHYEHIFLI